MRGRNLDFWKLFLVLGSMALTVILAAGLAMAAKEAPLISTEALKADLGKPGLTIIDMRSADDWAKSDKKIKGAVREDPKVIDWAKKYPKDQDIVLYCA